MKQKCRLTITCLLLMICSVNAQEKNTTITIGERAQVTSSVLHESRDILLYAPSNLKQKLPLIIVFDGESLFEQVVSTVRFMNYSSEMPQMPEAVVAGIINTKRNRDMPIPQEFGGTGEENFKKFLTNELVPILKNKYPLNDHIIVIGHSQGGLFASYLLQQSPDIFSWALALDAPMAVDMKTNKITEGLSAMLHNPANRSRYVSVESWYGWGDDWQKKIDAGAEKTLRIKSTDESHESMPLKGIYDGLKFLYHDFPPPAKDFTIAALLSYYHELSVKYGYSYTVPYDVLISSARRKMLESRKMQVMDILEYTEEQYGPSVATAKLKNDAAKITGNNDSLIDHYLNLPKPTPGQVKKYIGRWVGTLIVRDGQDMPMDITISVENGKTKLTNVLPWPPYDKEEPLIFAVSEDGKLIFGRKNRGSGVVIATSEIDASGKLNGKESLVGFTIQDDFPAEVKERMKYIIDNPNIFTLTKK